MGNKRLLDLPDDVLLRVLRALMRDDGTQKAENMRDLSNVTKTCRRVGKLVYQMMSALRTTRVEVVEGVPYDVVTAMPHDVINGTLMTLLNDGLAMKALRVLRLSTMSRSQLQVTLDVLRACSSLKELCRVAAYVHNEQPIRGEMCTQKATVLLHGQRHGDGVLRGVGIPGAREHKAGRDMDIRAG
ncbi:hypothetical protein FGB62_9g49 [Gracilaria domingensis]|nr:hypothetical protein FGB62_9g49 [Gracilaria domingensis]